MKKYLVIMAALAAPVLAATTSPAQIATAQAQLAEAQDAVADATKLAQDYNSITITTADDVMPPGYGAAGTADRALVIPRESGEPKDLASLEEDLKIMARILHKAANGGSEKSRSAMGIAIHGRFPGEGAMPQNLYLEGYGALFFLDVNYPLIAPAGKKAEDEAKEETSSEWDEARRELHLESGGRFKLNQIMTFGTGPVEAYDADKVEGLKTGLITALKNAAHIKKLKGDESVTVVVADRGGKAEVRIMTRRMGSGSSGSSGGGGSGMGGGMGGGGAAGGGGGFGGGGFVTQSSLSSADAQSGRLILRARKSDIDAFQKDKLSLEDFRKKVTVILH